MFKCELGNHTTEPNEPQVKLIAEIRMVTYKQANREFKGTEIVRTINACNKCVSDKNLVTYPYLKRI